MLKEPRSGFSAEPLEEIQLTPRFRASDTEFVYPASRNIKWNFSIDIVFKFVIYCYRSHRKWIQMSLVLSLFLYISIIYTLQFNWKVFLWRFLLIFLDILIYSDNLQEKRLFFNSVFYCYILAHILFFATIYFVWILMQYQKNDKVVFYIYILFLRKSTDTYCIEWFLILLMYIFVLYISGAFIVFHYITDLKWYKLAIKLECNTCEMHTSFVTC